MKRISLNGKWRMLEGPTQPLSAKDIKIPAPDCDEWMDIDVPGDINQTLLLNQKIPNPHQDTQARECYWITSKEWWYYLEFDACSVGQEADLCLTGVDGHAQVWLNGSYLGELQNSFRMFRIPVNGKLKPHGNTLYLRFKSIDQLLGGSRLDELAGWKSRRAFLRKPQFSFGWDWALPLPSLGLSSDIWIEYDNQYRFVDLSIQTYTTGRVDLAFEVTADTKEAGYGIQLKVWGHGYEFEDTLSRKSHKSYTSIEIPEPLLWWPNGYGKPHLYDYSIALIVDSRIVDSKEGRFGIRETKIKEEYFTPDAGAGFSFSFEINGEDIFSKGANWIPLELWPGTINPEQYEFYLRKAHEANFNMIRVWGGGIYESEIFYRLCDEFGIMIWQDFMFASTGYPVNLLRDEIIREANYQIRRLRNHPCIVIWCGCNEDVFSWTYPRGKKESSDVQLDSGIYSETTDGWEVNRLGDDPQIYTMILRGLVSKLGLGVPYVESSPQSRDDEGNMPNSGNSHISCWKYALFESEGKPENFRKHFEKICSFNSEFCIQGPCSQAAIKSFMRPENIWPPNDAWIYHIQRGHANLPHYEQTMYIGERIFGTIDSLEKYVKYGQIVHAEMMRAEFESARRDRPNNGGTMVWMFNDCWPTSNWSIIDYYRHPKPSYYAAKRSCAPLLPVIMERAGNIDFFLCNDTLKDTVVTLEYGQQSLNGSKIWIRKKELLLRANHTLKFDSFLKNDLAEARSDFLYIEAAVDNRKLPPVSYFVHGWKGIPWPLPNISMECTEQERTGDCLYTRFRIKGDSFVRFCHFLCDREVNMLEFSDSYFDLPAFVEREINVISSLDFDFSDLSVRHWLTPWE